jgi:hypothetical protein
MESGVVYSPESLSRILLRSKATLARQTEYLWQVVISWWIDRSQLKSALNELNRLIYQE